MTFDLVFNFDFEVIIDFKNGGDIVSVCTLVESFYDLGLKNVGTCDESRVGPLF